MTEDWFNLKLTQAKTSGDFRFSIFIDNIKVHSTINSQPEVFGNVQAEFGRMRDRPNFKIADGSYRNLQLKSKKCDFLRDKHLFSSSIKKHLLTSFVSHGVYRFADKDCI